MNYFKMLLLIIYHPVECMVITKREKSSRWWMVPVFYGTAAFAKCLYAYTVHFSLTEKSPQNINIPLEIAVLILPLLSWVICSYLMTSLIDGESTLKDQLAVSCYCTVPYTLITLISIVISQFMSLEEAGIFNAIKGAGLIWMVVLLLVSLMILNDYSLSKTLGIAILSLIAVVILWAVLILLFSLTVQLFSLVFNLIKEIQLKGGL